MLGIGTENRDVDALAPLAGDLGVVVDLQVVPIKAVALDELAQNLLHQQLLGRGAFLVAGQDVDEKVIRAALFGSILRGFNDVVLIAHPFCSLRNSRYFSAMTGRSLSSIFSLRVRVRSTKRPPMRMRSICFLGSTISSPSGVRL